MKYSNTVEYNIKTSLDSKGLTQLKSELQGLELKLQNMGNKGFLDEKTFVDARNQIQGLGQALTDAFNPSLGMLDLSKLNQELKNNDVTAQGLKTAFSSLGAEGQVAFNNLVGELGKLDTGILRTNSQIDKLFTTFSNTFRWGLVSSFFSQFMNAIHSSVDYVKELDDSLTQIMLVTDYNRDSMNEFAKSANEAAKAVSMTTTGMTNASLIFAQQGYDLGQSQELATLSAKLANASQQDTATTSDQITAYMNAYGLENSVSELTQAMDNWALIANISAADVSELAQASQRAASMANTVGVSGEQLAAQIATIESVTREAPEQIGNGLKTLYARFSDISGGGMDEDGVDLGKVTSQLDAIGVQVLDQFGNIRDVGDIMEDLMVVWDDLDQTSKIAAAQSLAGKYQVNRFVSLMDNSDMYKEYLGATGSSAAGTLDQMNEEYAQSIEGRSAKLQASLEGLFSTVFNTDDIYPWIDAAQGAIDLLQQFFDALGGGKTVLLGISSLLMQVFSKNMAQEINNAATNRAVQQQKLENLQNSQAALTTLGIANPNPNDANSQSILNFAQYMQANAKNFNAEQMDQANSILQELVQNSNAATMAADKLKDSLSVIGTGITATTGESILAPFLDSEGAVNATLLSEALQNMSQSEVADMFSHIQEDIKPAREGLLEFNKALQDYQQELRNVDSTDDSWNQSLNNLKATLLNLKDYIDPTTYERYEQAVNEISQVTENAGDKTAETTVEVAKLAEGLEKVAAKDLTNLNQLNKDAFQAKNTQMATDDSGKVAKAFEQGMDSQAQIQGILNTLNAVQQLTFAWQAFQNLGSIWSNSNLSEGEKLLQTIMTLGTALPSVITAVQTLQTTMDGLIAKDKEWITQTLEAPQKAIDQAQSEREAMQAIYEKAEANLFAAQSELSNAEAEVNGIEIVLRAIDTQIAYTKSIYETAKAKAIANNDSIKLAQLEAQETASITKMQADRAKAEIALAGAKEKVTAAQIKVTEAQQRTQAASAALSAAFMGVNTAMSAYSGAMLIAANRTEGLGVALTFLEKHPVIIALTAIAMAATTIFGIIKGQAEEAKQQAQEAFDEAQSKLEQIQSLRESVDNFNEKYNSFKETGEGGQGLAQDAEAIADAMREAGSETQAAAIHLAAIQAEARGTADSFDKLAQEVEKVQFEAEAQANQEVLKTAKETLKTQDASIEDVMKHQKMIKDAQQELNNLNSWDPGYEEKKEQLERYIQTLKDAKLSQDDLLTAATEGMAAQGRLVGMNALGLNGDNNGMQTKARGWENVEGPADAIRTADAETLREFFSQNVEGFGLLDSMEQLDFMLQNVQDDAQKAAIQVQQLLESNENLTANRVTDYGAGDFGNSNDYNDITAALTQTDLSAENSFQLIASLDEDASKAEILSKISQIQNEMESNNGDFALALKATLDPEELERAKEQVRDSISSMEPTDSDLDQDSFQETAKYFQEMAEELDDVPDEIALSSEALQDFTEAVLRYDDALQDADEHLEDWKKTLTDSSRSASNAAEAFEGIRDLVGDLLDLDTSDLSHNFMESADALDLLDTAIYGTGDEADAAYDQLNALANLDMAGMLDWEDGVWSLNDSFNQLSDAASGVGEDAVYAMDTLRGVMEGTISAPEIDASAFVNGLNDMVQSGEMSVDQALAAMDGAQVEADVVTETEDQTDTKNAIGWKPVETEGVDINASIPVMPVGGPLANGAQPTMQEFSGHVGGWTFEPDTQEETETKETTVSSVGYKANKNGNGSGKISFKNGKHKAGSGGAKRNNATGGGGHSRPSGKGGGGGKSCFVAGTLISTSLGFRPIEQIQKGDIVLSYNKSLELNEYSEVLQTMIHDTVEPIYTLYIKDEQLRVTGIHRFLVTDKITCGIPQWVHAADLKVGQWVLFADGTWHVIHKIEVNTEHQTVYNFEVSGNHNYYVGRNQILAHNKGGGKGKKGGGGKAKTIEDKEKKDHQKDYYEEVDTQLEKVEKELSRIEKQQDKLTGDKARANQNKQLKLLQKQIELQKEHLRILTEEEKVDVTKHLKEQDKQAEKLIQKYSKLFVIPDPVYDEDGIISNYEQISKAIDDAHNKMIDEYNKAAKTGNEELTKQIQKDIDNLDKYGDAIRKDAQRINDITVEVEELNNTIQDLRDSMQDIRIDAFKQAVEARDGLKSIKEIAAEVNAVFREFDPDSFINSFSIDETPYENLLETMGKLDNIYNVTAEDAGKFYDDLIKQKQAALDKATDADEKAAIEQSIEFFTARKNNLSEDNLMNGYIGVLQDDLATLQEWMDNPESPENIFGTDTAALQEMFQETYEKLGDAVNEYRELIQDYRDSILDIYDEAEEAIDRQMDKYDNLTDKIKRMSDTYALYYGEDSYAELDKFYAQQGEIMQNQLNQLTTAYEYWNQQYQRALATGDKKLIQEIEDKMNDANDAMLEKAEELANLWVEKFENIVNANTQSIYDKLFNGNNFNDLTDSWELQKDYMERYKDEVEKSYEIDKLRSKYLDLLNDAQGTSLQTQNKIRQQMQEQLKQLQDQATVSEYDVKLANARLEILQKQIALEDAQRNKNQMQLRRDSQGNYRYTYRANQEDVKAAQDDLLDSEFDAYELTKNETISNNDRALNMIQNFLDRRAQIFNDYKDDDEARTKALEQLSADYSRLLGGMEEDFKDTTNGMYDVLTFLVENGTEDSATSAANMLDNLFESENKFKEDTEVLWASMTNNITDALGNFEDAVEEANGEMIAQTEDLKEKMVGNKGVLTMIGSSADTMTESLDKAAEATKSLATETQNLYDLFGSDDAKLQDALSSIEKYKQELQNTQDTTSSLAQSLKRANATLDTKTAEAQSYKTALDLVTGARQVREGTTVKLKKGTFVHYDRYGGVQQDAEGNTGWRLPEDMWVKFDAPATEPNAKYKYGFYATGESLTNFGKKQPGDNENGRQNTDQRRHQKWWFNEDELQRNVLAAMDTGGYTGEWGDETSLYKNGKLALLHQKELVLNSSDTKNILAAVEIVRMVAAGINNQLTSLSQNAGIRNFNSSLSSIGNEVQQRVEIKAEFPNVQDSYQIEQALLELSDQAYQYAHRNIRG